MRLALKIAYDGRAFYGHQRQPDARTVEGECLSSLRAAKILRNPGDAFFRSASRTDRGVSAVGNVIAFNTTFEPDAAVGAFNDRVRDVWAWAVAVVPDGFHPRHAVERWYRYHLFEPLPISALREAAGAFVGEHDFRWFTSDPSPGRLSIRQIEVSREEDLTCVDVRAPGFRRAMVRRIVAALVAHARGEADLDAIRAALQGHRHDFGAARPEPLFLMDVSYGFPFRAVLKPKVAADWRGVFEGASLRLLLVRALREASSRRTG